jgi:DNA modification methylase
MNYENFIQSKRIVVAPSGFFIDTDALNPQLFPFQRDIVRWALRRGNGGWVSNFEWILWARPVWYAADYQPGTWRPNYNGDGCDFGIRETDVLNVRQARETNDERHLCPLQIGVIERCVKVWSAPGEIVYSPFAGIGSEGYVAIKEGRRFIGGELKESYWRNAIRNLEAAAAERNQGMLFDLAAD